MNDLTDAFKNSNCVVRLHADDVKLYSSYKLGYYSPVITLSAIDHLAEWAKIWQL